MKNKPAWIVGILVVALTGIQAIPVERTNPPARASIGAPADVANALRRACYDCHSNETAWPWYSRVAPVAWLVSHDVAEGRGELNFSDWQALLPADQAKKKRKAWDQIAKGEMPPWYYVAMHRDARLAAQDRAALEAWLLTPGAGLTRPD